MSSAQAHAVDPHAENEFLAHHFESMDQQNDAMSLGMWLFLGQEVMFFGGVFVAYGIARYLFADAFLAGSQSLSWQLGAFNTVVLLISSYTMALAVYHAQTGNTQKLIRNLLFTLVLGITFVALKLVFEYWPKYEEGVIPGVLWAPHGHYSSLSAFAGPGGQGGLQVFFWLYFVMTGLHAVHMIIGFGIILVLLRNAAKGNYSAKNYMPIEMFGLYWHFVDIVWVFLYPFFYLVT